MAKRRVITVMELLEEFTTNAMHPEESDREIALQRLAFIGGIISALSFMADGYAVDANEVFENLNMALDEVRKTHPAKSCIPRESSN